MPERTDKNDKSKDNTGARGAGTGQKQEKGDKRRETPPHQGPTRPGGSSHGKPGSDSNEEKGS
jgi:hypothetical protein